MSESDIRMRVVQLALGNPELVDALEAFQRMYEEKLGAAHDAALKVAADAARVAQSPEAMKLSGRDKVVFNVGVRAAVESIEAHRYRPVVRYIPEDEVRRQATESLKQNMTGQWKLGVAALADALGANVDDALHASLHGVDLDATGEKACPYCHETHSRLTSCHRSHRESGPRGCDCTGAPHPEEPGCPGYASPTTEGNPTGEALLTLQRQEATTTRNPDAWTCISCGAELGRPHIEGCSFRSGEGSSHG